MSKDQTKAILIDVISPETSREEAEKRLAELESLVNTYGGVVVVKAIQKKGLPDYETYIGKGKVEEIFELAKKHDAKLLVVNNILKPKQIYNLNENLRKADVQTWDRVDLILKIFDKHAKSAEAKLQIQLASIKHMGPRIFNMGVELMQQTGAVGLRSGQGETNIEMMKRHLRTQELNILKKLKHYETINRGHRDRRKRQNLKTVAIVGYTNAGKSSLLKAITGKDVYIADQLFATLDTRIGKLYIPSATAPDEYRPGREILISDTIGFIQDLPPSLIQAFKSTLAETVEADLLLHVIDISDPEIEKKIRVIEEILDQLDLHTRPKIYVFNKIDLIDPRHLNAGHENQLKENLEMELFHEHERPPGMLPAGKHTAHILGWVNKEARENAVFIESPFSVQHLRDSYSQFAPVFVSANEKTNLQELIEKIASRID